MKTYSSLCMHLINLVIYVFLFLYLYILIVMYSPFSIFVFMLPTDNLRLPWLSFFRAFSSLVKKMPGCNSQIRSTARTLPQLFVLFCVLCVCKCVLCYCQRVSTQLQLTNISTYQHTPLNSNQTTPGFLSILSFYSCPKQHQ